MAFISNGDLNLESLTDSEHQMKTPDFFSPKVFILEFLSIYILENERNFIFININYNIILLLKLKKENPIRLGFELDGWQVSCYQFDEIWKLGKT